MAMFGKESHNLEASGFQERDWRRLYKKAAGGVADWLDF